jgi:hypothetical protein
MKVLKLIKLLHLLVTVILTVSFACLFLKCSQPKIILDSELSVEFSLVLLLPDKKLESKVDNIQLVKNMIAILKLSKKQSSWWEEKKNLLKMFLVVTPLLLLVLMMLLKNKQLFYQKKLMMVIILDKWNTQSLLLLEFQLDQKDHKNYQN